LLEPDYAASSQQDTIIGFATNPPELGVLPTEEGTALVGSLPIVVSYISEYTILPLYQKDVSRDTGYGLDDRGAGVRVPVVSRIFSSTNSADRL
jgi:hypothetical protein